MRAVRQGGVNACGGCVNPSTAATRGRFGGPIVGGHRAEEPSLTDMIVALLLVAAFCAALGVLHALNSRPQADRDEAGRQSQPRRLKTQ